MRRPLAIALLIFLSACGGEPALPDPGSAAPRGEVVFRAEAGDRSLSVGVADSDAERERGLMGVRDLPPDQGMAFLFDEPAATSFWMQDTLIPLSIAFVGEDGHILNIVEMTPCRTDPCPTYAADGPTIMAVEANAGWFDANGVSVGDEALLLEGS